jgi:hypothetical protein
VVAEHAGANQIIIPDCLAKAFLLYLFNPSHKWDGNEVYHHCRWLQPTDKEYQQKGFSQITAISLP